MKKFFLIVLALTSARTLFAQAASPIIPLPVQLVKTDGNLSLNSNTVIIAADSRFADVANFLQQEVLKNTGITMSFSTAPGTERNIVFQSHSEKKMKEEEYRLDIRSSGISIQAATPRGAFNAANSLLQLIRQSPVKKGALTLNGWSIYDTPAMAWRGIMLDESRHFFGKEAVKKILDWMAFYKLNKFHWHLTDVPGWRIEIRQYPKLTLVGGVGTQTNPLASAAFYTQEDIKEIVNYANDRFIEVIPEIDMPGHAAAANKAYPDFSGGGSEKYPEFTFNPGKEETYAYLTRILRETDVLFPGKKIHIGGDEVHFGNENWKTNKDVQDLMKAKNLSNLKAVEHYFLTRMADSVFKLNSKVLGWDEVINAGLPVNQSIIFWWRHDQTQQLKTALDKGYQTVLCPRVPLYFDFVQDSFHFSGRRWQGNFSSLEKVYSFSNNWYPDIINEKNKDLILGIQANIWTESIATEPRLDYMLFPRISALAEAAWTKPEDRNFSGFKDRLAKHLNLYQKQGIFYYNPLKPSERPEVVDVFKNEIIED